MGVYVDDMRASYGRMKLCHMVADSIDELIAMANTIGLDRKWYQPQSHPHFDVSLTMRARAIENGAVLVDRRELVEAMKRHRALWTQDPVELEKLKLAAREVRGTSRCKSSSCGGC